MTRLSELIRGESKHSLSIPRWLERLASIGIVTANPEIARRQRITNIGAFVAAGTTIGHLVINAVHDPGGLISVHIFNAVFALLALLIPNLHRYGENAAAVGLATLCSAWNNDYRLVARYSKSPANLFHADRCSAAFCRSAKLEAIFGIFWSCPDPKSRVRSGRRQRRDNPRYSPSVWLPLACNRSADRPLSSQPAARVGARPCVFRRPVEVNGVSAARATNRGFYLPIVFPALFWEDGNRETLRFYWSG
jgi:hypothetical protein